MTNANGSLGLDPASTGTLIGFFQKAWQQKMLLTDCFIPVRVIAYDRVTNRASVQPLIQTLDTNNDAKSRGQIASIPALQYGGGGFVLSFNYNPGDLGWILAADRDISLFLQSYAEAKPNTFRIKDFSSGLFIPDVMHNVTVADEDEDAAILQSVDGTVKIALSTALIKMKAPAIDFENTDGSVTFSLGASGASIGGTSITVNTVNAIVNASSKAVFTTPLAAFTGDVTAGGSFTPNTPPP